MFQRFGDEVAQHLGELAERPARLRLMTTIVRRRACTRSHRPFVEPILGRQLMVQAVDREAAIPPCAGEVPDVLGRRPPRRRPAAWHRARNASCSVTTGVAAADRTPDARHLPGRRSISRLHIAGGPSQCFDGMVGFQRLGESLTVVTRDYAPDVLPERSRRLLTRAPRLLDHRLDGGLELSGSISTPEPTLPTRRSAPSTPRFSTESVDRRDKLFCERARSVIRGSLNT